MGSNLGWQLLKPEPTELLIRPSSESKLDGESCYEKAELFRYHTSDVGTERDQPSSLFVIHYTLNNKTNERTVIVYLISQNLQHMIKRALLEVKDALLEVEVEAEISSMPVTSVEFKTLFRNRTPLRKFRDADPARTAASILDKAHFGCFIGIFEDLCKDLDKDLEKLVECGLITWEFLPELFLPGTEVLRNDGTNHTQDKAIFLSCEETVDKGLELILRILLDEEEVCSISIPEFDGKVAITSLKVYPKDFMMDQSS